MKTQKKVGNYILIIIIPAIIVYLDRITKQWAVRLEDQIQVINGLLYFDYTWNTGVAFGLFKGHNWFFILVAIIAFAAIIYYYPKLSKPEKIGALFILGGLIGNLWDRIAYGQVTDFIQIPYWPVFNIADMSITIGAVIIGVYYLTTRKTSP